MDTRSPQLDALRGIAVSLVVVHHWTSWGPSLGLGNIGVQLFFVLSGFLITRILLSAKDRCAADASDLKGTLVSFHANRIARIWPVFYLTIALVFIAGDHFEHRADLGWHALFGSNLLFFQRGEFGSGLPHFWSLAVEQQFYLLWPLVVLAVPLNYTEVLILALIGLAPLMRMALYVDGFTAFAQYNVLPFANFDSLGSGALMALWSRSPKAVASGRWHVLRVLAAAAAVTLIGFQLFAPLPGNPEQTLLAVMFAWIVTTAWIGFDGPLGRVLEWRPLVSLGMISYGVYVYHMFAPRIVGYALRLISAPIALQSGAPLFLISAALTLAVATLSWVLLERPILDWRRGMQSSPRARAI